MKTFKILSAILLLISSSVFALDESSVQEIGCSIPPRDPKDVNLDLEWMGSIKEFYVPLWSKLYSYRLARYLLEKEVNSISESEVDQPTCLIFKQPSEVLGFGQDRFFNITGSETALTWKPNWPGAKRGKYVFHLTDNKSFILGITCWEDNQSAWAMLSTTMEVTPEVREQVLEYVSSRGFDRNLTKEEIYDNCPIKAQAPPSAIIAEDDQSGNALAVAVPVRVQGQVIGQVQASVPLQQLRPAAEYVYLYPSYSYPVQKPVYYYPGSYLPFGNQYQHVWKK